MRDFVFDQFQVLLEVADCFGGVEIEDGLAGRLPAAAVEEEDGRSVPQVADGGQAFHVAALDGLE